jgi:hypothetical protein
VGTWSNAKLVLWMFIVGCIWAFVLTMSTFQWDVFKMDSNAWRAVVVAILTQCGTVATMYIAPWVKQFGWGAR